MLETPPSNPTEQRTNADQVQSPEIAERIARSTNEIHEIASTKMVEAQELFGELGIEFSAIPKNSIERVGWRPGNWESMTEEVQRKFIDATRALGLSERYDWIAKHDEHYMAYTAKLLERAQETGMDVERWNTNLQISELQARVDTAVIKFSELPLGEAAARLGYSVGEGVKQALSAFRPGVKRTDVPGYEPNDRIVSNKINL